MNWRETEVKLNLPKPPMVRGDQVTFRSMIAVKQ